jgi:hypothetical protein
MRKALLAAACLALFATQAQAADICYIKEYNTIGSAHGVPAQIANEPAVTDQATADFTSGAVQSNAFQPATTFIRLWCSAQASYVVGTNPTATNANSPVAAGIPEYFGVPEGGNYKLSVHTNP